MSDPSLYEPCVAQVDEAMEAEQAREEGKQEDTELCFVDVEAVPQFRMPIVAPSLAGLDEPLDLHYERREGEEEEDWEEEGVYAYAAGMDMDTTYGTYSDDGDHEL